MTRRTQSRFARCWWVLVVAACLLSRGSVLRGADAVSIAELMNAKRKGLWTAYAQSGASMKVEGRYSVFSPTLLRFLNCQDLNFVWYKEDEHFPIETSSVHSRNLEVFGHFEMRSASPVFVVRQFRTLPSDEDSLRERKDSLINSPAAEWYALGKWAAARGASTATRPWPASRRGSTPRRYAGKRSCCRRMISTAASLWPRNIRNTDNRKTSESSSCRSL